MLITSPVAVDYDYTRVTSRRVSRCGEMRCGMFCCLANVWEKMNEEQEVDVFNVVRQIRLNRPEFLVDEVITAVSMSCFSLLPLWRSARFSYCRAIARCLAPLCRSLEVEGRCKSRAPALLFGSFTYGHPQLPSLAPCLIFHFPSSH